ncbi:MAG: hypothetical protein V2J08_01965 [Desulfotignum sp.]|nr:hypothetical protein [Desulfotignum sp.]
MTAANGVVISAMVCAHAPSGQVQENSSQKIMGLVLFFIKPHCPACMQLAQRPDEIFFSGMISPLSLKVSKQP